MFKCFLCEKEFSASALPLHETKCLKRWNKANGSDNEFKPTRSLSEEEWDAFGWNIVNSIDKPCSLCGKTFEAEDMIAHVRTCKSPLEASTSHYTFSNHASVTWAITEEKKETQKEQPRKDFKKRCNSESARKAKKNEANQQKYPCYLCGEEISIDSVYIHEMECFENWRKRHGRQEDILSEEEDTRQVLDGLWEVHLPDQVNCRKCGQKYFVYNIEKHENDCVGAPTNIKGM